MKLSCKVRGEERDAKNSGFLNLLNYLAQKVSPRFNSAFRELDLSRICLLINPQQQ